ncbi:MAG TPA: hypothetical protein PL117_03270 [Accumulibacter sp.]|uniref:hypothetical protein n=1 Tax=Accumulibacter sp. TaxID=2053492 RepID=UPI002C54DF97|nr:hypothetical protein [Accumulibacter sp.]HRF71768.1 hypothetical protein [Accumulibacter sp.]
MLLEKLMDEYREILAKEERAKDDNDRALRVRAQSLRDHGEQMLANSLGCSVRELIKDVNAYQVDERLGMLVVQIPLIVPGVFLKCSLSQSNLRTKTVQILDVRTVYLCDAGSDEPALLLPAAREMVIKLLGDAVEAQ